MGAQSGSGVQSGPLALAQPTVSCAWIVACSGCSTHACSPPLRTPQPGAPEPGLTQRAGPASQPDRSSCPWGPPAAAAAGWAARWAAGWGWAAAGWGGGPARSTAGTRPAGPPREPSSRAARGPTRCRLRRGDTRGATIRMCSRPSNACMGAAGQRNRSPGGPWSARGVPPGAAQSAAREHACMRMRRLAHRGGPGQTS